MDGNSVLNLIEKAKEIIGEREYIEIRNQYKRSEQNLPFSVKYHAIITRKAKKLFETALKANADDIDLKFIACYFLIVLDSLKHNLDVKKYELDNSIKNLREIYMTAKTEE